MHRYCLGHSGPFWHSALLCDRLWVFFCHCRYHWRSTYCIFWLVFSGSFHGTVRTIVAFLIGECTLCCCISCKVFSCFVLFLFGLYSDCLYHGNFSMNGYAFVYTLESHSVCSIRYWSACMPCFFKQVELAERFFETYGEIFMIVARWRTGEYLVITRFWVC
jgi:hypothetical protein